MGAWGARLLENDLCLDEIENISVGNILCYLNGSEYVDLEILAIECVDISLNGIDEDILGSMQRYKNFFKSLVGNKELMAKKEYAISLLPKVMKKDLKRWFDKQEREKVYKSIEQRLKNGK